MKTIDWVTGSFITLVGFAALRLGYNEMAINCFLSVYIIITIKSKT